MFKIWISAMTVGAILGVLEPATGPPASALDRHIQLTNNARMAMVEIYVSHFGSELWNIDLLGADYLAPASSVLVNIQMEWDVDLTSKPSSTTEPPRSAEMSTYARSRDLRSPIDNGGVRAASEPYLEEASTRTARQVPRLRSERANRRFDLVGRQGG